MYVCARRANKLLIIAHYQIELKIGGASIMTGGMYSNPNDKYTGSFEFDPLKNIKSHIFFIAKGVEPPFPEEHEPFDVYFNFENRGLNDVGKFKVRIITESKENSSLGVDVEDQIVTSLKQGETGEAILKFDYGMPAGKYVINAYLGYYNQSHEKHEDVNYRHTSYMVIVG